MPNTPLRPPAPPTSSSLGISLLQYQEHNGNATADSENASASQQRQHGQSTPVRNDDDDGGGGGGTHNDLIRYASLQGASAAATATAAPAMSRSSPIAIVRSPGRGGNQRTEESDADDDDDDGDSGEIDVERDARTLRRKYGDSNIVRTYHQEFTHPLNGRGSSIPNAPYLGSLSSSANQVSSLPPMSLAGGEDAYYRSDPPDAILSYGSLRESHQRGRFLDGPSSYREPTSGRIQQLDHRLRFHGRPQPKLSIGERIERKIQLKGQAGKKQGSEATRRDESNGKQPVASSLSAIMDKVSMSADSTTAGSERGEVSSDGVGKETWTPVPTNVFHHTSLQEDLDEQTTIFREPPSMMLSTSLTAFEVMKTSNLNRGNVASTYASQSSSALAAANLSATSGFIDAASANQANARTQVFQPLARSMSDPNPRHYHSSLLGFGWNANPATLTAPTAALAVAPPPRDGHQQQQLQQQQHPLLPHAFRAAGQVPMFPGSLAAAPAAAFPASGFQFSQQPVLDGLAHQSDHDPDTEGAFGDMDME